MVCEEEKQWKTSMSSYSNQMKQKDKTVNDYVFNNKIVTHPDFVVHRSTILMQKWGILLMEKEKS